jgi:hypothetical protein
MDSHEIMREAICSVGAKSIAHDMRLSASLIYKWCEPKENAGGGGADNPLDRILKICELTGDCSPIDWLCLQTGTFRVKNPDVYAQACEPVLKTTQTILKEFSDVLQAVSSSYETGNRIDAEEAKRIRKEWEELKMVAETFVFSCEHGVYDKEPVD